MGKSEVGLVGTLADAHRRGLEIRGTGVFETGGDHGMRATFPGSSKALQNSINSAATICCFSAEMIGIIPGAIADSLETKASTECRATILQEAGFRPDQEVRLKNGASDEACCRISHAVPAGLLKPQRALFHGIAVYFLDLAEKAFTDFFTTDRDPQNFLLPQPAIHNSLVARPRLNPHQEAADTFRVVPIGNGVGVYDWSPNRLSGVYFALAGELARRRAETAELRYLEGDADTEMAIMKIQIRPRVEAGNNA